MNQFLKIGITGVSACFLFAGPVQAQQRQFIDRSNMDLSVIPGNDFYEYASGTWVKNNPVPAKETRWGSFNMLRDFNINAVKSILEKARANKSAPAGSVEKRVGDFYAAGMDSAAIEKLGHDPIKKDLASIEAIKTLPELLQKINQLRSNGIASPLYGFYVGQDRKNVEVMIPQLGQGGTSLPDRDNYLKDDQRSVQIRAAFTSYVSRLFGLVGANPDQATANASIVFNIEKQLAEAQLSRVEMRDAYKTYNKFSLADLSGTTPGLDWKTTLQELDVKGQDSVLVNNPAFFATVAGLLKTVPLNDWKVYLQWNILKGAAPYLSTAFVNANFAFTQALTGQKIQTPRWQRMSSLTDGNIGELLGQLYVKEYFKPAAKARMEELVANLRKAFAIRIKGLDWMSAATKEKALAKLAAFRPKIAYPDKWENYEGLTIDRHHFFQNIRNVNNWAYHFMIGRLGKPVDRERWGMTPPTVNAYYNATLNEIVFPAGILQFPFFDPNADDAVNYGGIGAVIGHEMSHGFDDNGSKYDADGTLRNWWTDEDRQKFDAKAAALARQFDGYTVLDTLHVNGKLTLGENIGDLGGMSLAYEAFKMTRQGQSNKKIDGFTPDQRFFLSWAQVWRGNILPETAAQFILTDPHSPGPYRTIGPLVNMDAWYKAFDVKEGDKLYKKPEDRIRIW
ncbi:M13 family metallopeptidase [Niabella drilacis]|uniref:Endothelin-converting enzyme. Metallo peptidase. MEROPS family M13 n=1 Tax=Niabella drilacis (strain DSM 25811 / CCM 8410 / CCUG 62505 / LMG 26954 / E90) TaxID=1285928 RepID=A0A1G6Q4G3_NIADE|nr:M13 family metallopeptidase [Niabella drilacis]SDC87233.1 endothelin-converting enzyme . Metallo peptidase. MEROPS family M13 [Niabella drilacis]